MNEVLEEYLQTQGGEQPYRLAQPQTEVNVEFTEFFKSFRIDLPKTSCSYAADLTLDLPDLLDRFELLKERLERLSQRITERRQTAQRFSRRLAGSLQYLASDFENNRRAWWMVEQNPAAAARRTFLQEELLRLQDRLYETELQDLDRTIELERERDQLRLEYVQLRRVAQAIHG